MWKGKGEVTPNSIYRGLGGAWDGVFHRTEGFAVWLFRTSERRRLESRVDGTYEAGAEIAESDILIFHTRRECSWPPASRAAGPPRIAETPKETFPPHSQAYQPLRLTSPPPNLLSSNGESLCHSSENDSAMASLLDQFPFSCILTLRVFDVAMTGGARQLHRCERPGKKN